MKVPKLLNNNKRTLKTFRRSKAFRKNTTLKLDGGAKKKKVNPRRPKPKGPAVSLRRQDDNKKVKALPVKASPAKVSPALRCKMTEEDNYAKINIEKGCLALSKNVRKKQLKDAKIITHPDLNPGCEDEATEKFKKIQEACDDDAVAKAASEAASEATPEPKVAPTPEATPEAASETAQTPEVSSVSSDAAQTPEPEQVSSPIVPTSPTAVPKIYTIGFILPKNTEFSQLPPAGISTENWLSSFLGNTAWPSLGIIASPP